MFSLVLTTFSGTSLNSRSAETRRSSAKKKTNHAVKAACQRRQLLSLFYNTFSPLFYIYFIFFLHPTPKSPSSGYRGGLPTLDPYGMGMTWGGCGADLGGSGGGRGVRGEVAPGVEPSPPACPPLLSARCLHFSCLFPSPYPVSFWPANFNLKLDWADLMQIPPGKTLKLMNSYVKSILHHREKVTSARKKNNKVKETRAFHV